MTEMDAAPPSPVEQLREAWPALPADERVARFRELAPKDAFEFFLDRGEVGRAMILLGLAERERPHWLKLLPPDDAADVLQEIPPEVKDELLLMLKEPLRSEVTALLAYAEDDAGGLMSPRFARARPEMTVEQAIHYLRRQARGRLETIYYIYVLDHEQHLLGVVSFRELFLAPGEKLVREVMRTDFFTVSEDLDQEAVARLIARHDLMAVPVVDAEARMKGIVTVDDIVDVVQEEATEDIQKIGGMAALDRPYLQSGLLEMVRKRAGWLCALFIGETLTASAMAHYEEQIARAVVLALFVPLIISSGGNAGSQASTLVIRAMALGEVRLRDWWRVIRRELAAGLALGGILAAVGLARVFLWESLFDAYGAHHAPLAFTVAGSLLGVVTWGTVIGSLLPFVLRRLGFDPASASAPFVATLVDVCGLVIYFSIAQSLLKETLL